MRFMIIVKATKDSEAGRMPEESLIASMAAYHEELVKAGILLDANGLQPSSRGFRIRYEGNKRRVIDGPFAETKELIAGFWIWQVKSMDEAIAWVKRCPMEEGVVLEVRPVFEADDFGEAFTPELRAQEERLMAEAQKLAKK